MSDTPPEEIPSDLDALLQQCTPERQVLILKARARLQRFEQNDEILALLVCLDSVAVLVDTLIRKNTVDVDKVQDSLDKLNTFSDDLLSRLERVGGLVEVLKGVTRERLRWLLALVFLCGVLVTPAALWVLQIFHQ